MASNIKLIGIGMKIRKQKNKENWLLCLGEKNKPVSLIYGTDL